MGRQKVLGLTRLTVALLLTLVIAIIAACESGRQDEFLPSPGLSETPVATLTTDAAAAAPTAVADRAALLAPSYPVAAGDEPLGFPIDPDMKLGVVLGLPGGRHIEWGDGPTAEQYSREDQPSADPERANRSGWNCRVHVEYEGQAAVDWYIPLGTPVFATMDGTATLLVNTSSNAFDVYSLDREPYLGNPDRTRAPVVPFPGPSGGQGVFVRIENARFRTDYAHLDLLQTLAIVPEAAFLPGYSPQSDLARLFAPLRDFRTATPIARWTVRRGEGIGFSGDSGYSEAPHLHYTMKRADSPRLLCPTLEAGFDAGGWLFK